MADRSGTTDGPSQADGRGGQLQLQPPTPVAAARFQTTGTARKPQQRRTTGFEGASTPEGTGAPFAAKSPLQNGN